MMNSSLRRMKKAVVRTKKVTFQKNSAQPKKTMKNSATILTMSVFPQTTLLRMKRILFPPTENSPKTRIRQHPDWRTKVRLRMKTIQTPQTNSTNFWKTIPTCPKTILEQKNLKHIQATKSCHRHKIAQAEPMKRKTHTL